MMDDDDHDSIPCALEAELVEDQQSISELRDEIRAQLEQEILGDIVQAEAVVHVSAYLLLTNNGNSVAAAAVQNSRSNEQMLTASDSVTPTLRFSELDLYGREKQIEKIELAFQEIYEEDRNSKALVLIEGVSGSGKTSLALSMKEEVFQSNGFFIYGKYDLQQIEEPFHGIKTALNDLCEQILRLNGGPYEDYDLEANSDDPRSFEDIKARLCSELERIELEFLINFIPKLELIVGSEYTNQNMGNETGLRKTADRLKYSLRRFVSVICRYAPLVLVCDDIHWSDQGSLDLIGSCIINSSTSSVMVIGCYRSNLVDSGHKLSAFIRDVEDIAQDRLINIQRIDVEDLTLFCVGKVLQDLLLMEANDIDDLATVVFQKTGGNVFYVIQLLISMQKDHLLTYSPNLKRWIWNVPEIKATYSATENVAELMKQKLRQVSVARRILPIAASLGSTFNINDVVFVLQRVREGGPEDSFYDCFIGLGYDVSRESLSFSDREHIVKELEECETEGFIETTPLEQSYKFVHDKVREAALSVYPKGLLTELQYRIGDMISSFYEHDNMERVMFTVVGLLNGGVEMFAKDKSTRLKIAMLNMEAGKRAMSCSAFHPSTEYFQAATHLMPKDHYELSLELYSLATEAKFCTGDFEGAREYGVKVINHQSPAVNKLRVYHVFIDMLTAEKRFKESIDLGLEVLRLFGCKFPQRKANVSLSTLIGMLQCKHWGFLFQAPTSVSQLPVATDSVNIGVMKTLHKIASSAYASKSPILLLVCLKEIQLAFRCGITSQTPVALAFLANLIGDCPAAMRMRQQAIAMFECMDYAESEARTMFVVHAFITHWTNPFRQCLKPLQEAHQLGMGSGDPRSAMYASLAYNECSLYAGVNLAAIDESMAKHIDQMKEFGQMHGLKQSCSARQAVRKPPRTQQHAAHHSIDWRRI